jgi:transcriptional regulator with XRE-family HTH domain
VKRVLAERGWTQQEAASAMGVTREQVARWATKGGIPLHRLASLAERSGVLVVLELGHKETASPSDWGRRLREDVAQVTDLLEELAEHRAAALAAEAAASRLAADESADDPLADGRDAAPRPDRPCQ